MSDLQDYSRNPQSGFIAKPSRLCVICGASVRNQNPKTKTRSPACTTKLHGTPETEPHFRRCNHCGMAVDRGDICDVCEMELWINNH